MVEGVPTLVAPHAREQATKPPRLFRLLRGMRRDQRGVAVVEFAIVAIPLFLIVLGIIDFGRALNYYNDLTQLAGQGARFAAVNQEPGSAGGTAQPFPHFQQDLAGFADSPELKGATSDFQICIAAPASGTTWANGDPITVTAKYTFHFIPFISPIALPLSSSQTERFEGITSNFTSGCHGP
jgi:Flp pilus assembly protein TadG